MYGKNGDVVCKELVAGGSILIYLHFLNNHVTILRHCSTYHEVKAMLIVTLMMP
jgi:hypothetical protein